jgi:hypothetical protein
MNQWWMDKIAIALIVVVASAYALCQSVSVPSRTAADDPYAPLRLYNGNWEFEMTDGKEVSHMRISNHCEKTGLFFVCEQVIDDKPSNLAVFLPTGNSAGKQNYRTQGLSVDTGKPRDWGNLEISGNRWVYSSEEMDKGEKVYWRIINVFSGADKIHFEVQHSTDAKTWNTKQSGDERRDIR